MKEPPFFGVTPRELMTPGTAVMVAVGGAAALVNGGAAVVAWAVVVGPVSIEPDYRDPDQKYWLDLYMIPGGPPVSQMYRAKEILGVPAFGLTMEGAPERRA